MTSAALVPASTLDTIAYARAAWLHEKLQRSGSERTHTTYGTTFDAWRAALQAVGLDVDSPARAVADVTQVWAAVLGSDRARRAAASTYNQRLAIVSSFYTFARRRELLDVANPVETLQRARVDGYAGAQALDAEEVAARLDAIERSTPAGLRDYALLALGFSTGHRLAELVALDLGDLRISGGRCTVTWRRCKGGKVMHDVLPASVFDALAAWLRTTYGPQWMTADPHAPVWRSLSRQTAGNRLSARGIEYLCGRRLGVGKVHALRHTFAHSMEEVGAKVSDIQARLGHSSMATTGRYLQALRSAENPHAEDVAALFGISGQRGKGGQVGKRKRKQERSGERGEGGASDGA